MNEEEILALLRTRLSLQSYTQSQYTGGNDSLYKDVYYVRLVLDGNEVISEVCLS